MSNTPELAVPTLEGGIRRNPHWSERGLKVVAPALRSGFMRNVAVLMSGTALAQVLGIAATPILTRLYEPSVFGLVGVFTAIVVVVAVLSALSYEMTLMLPVDDADAANLLGLTFLLLAAAALITLVLVAVGGESFALAAGVPGLQSWLWFLPLVVLTAGGYNALTYWCIRRKAFGKLSISRVSRSVGMATTQIAAGFAGFLSAGLMVGYLVGQVLATTLLGFQVWRAERTSLVAHLQWRRIRELAARYVDFPKYRAPHELIYAFSDNATIFVFAAFFDPLIVGFYVLAQKLLQAPMELVGGSIRQAFYPRATEAYATGIDQLNSLTRRATLMLFSVSVVPTLAVILFAPALFGFAFAEKWLASGTYSQYLVLYVVSSFVRMPVATAVLLLELQRFQLGFIALRSIVMLGAIAVGAYLGSEVTAVGGYAISGLLFNLGFILYVTLYLQLKARA